VTPDSKKKSKKRNIFSKRVIFSTDCSQSIGLQSVLKPRVKTPKLFALQASPYKGSKQRVNLDAFVFSTAVDYVYIAYNPSARRCRMNQPAAAGQAQPWNDGGAGGAADSGRLHLGTTQR
jgi:hypothetical protein